MYRRGLVTRQGIDIPLARTESVEFRHSLIDPILRTGTLIIESRRTRSSPKTVPTSSRCTHCCIMSSPTR